MERICLPLIFQDSMVLQRRKPVCIWGEAEECTSVRVTLGEDAAVAEVSDGKWKAYLPPREAAIGLTLTVSGGRFSISFTDVAVGEVWIAGGQSNMEYLLKHDADREEALLLENPDIRCYEVPKISFPGQEAHYRMSDAGVWRKESRKESPYFTAVGFYFANRLYETLQVPVGVINCTWGGTSASCWVSEDYLTGDLQFYLDKAREVRSSIDPEETLEKYIALQKNILSSDIDMGKPNLAPIRPLLDEAAHDRLMAMNNWPCSAFRPCGLFTFMLKTIVPYTVSGVIWYQGESDEYFSEHYESMMRAVIRCWRSNWREDLPFLMVQLASFEVMAEYLDFVPIRKAQAELAKKDPGVYLVTAMDTGMRYDIHPKRKKPVGVRLALQALDKVYHRHLPADSPTVLCAQWVQESVVVRLKHCGSGLHVKGERPETFDISADGENVSDFTVSVRPHELVLTADAFLTAHTLCIAFCQRAYCELTIYNSADLPVLPFNLSLSR